MSSRPHRAVSIDFDIVWMKVLDKIAEAAARKPPTVEVREDVPRRCSLDRINEIPQHFEVVSHSSGMPAIHRVPCQRGRVPGEVNLPVRDFDVL